MELAVECTQNCLFQESGLDFCFLFGTDTDSHVNLYFFCAQAVFMGPNDEYVVAGSDDGFAYIWDRVTGRILRVLPAGI